MKVAKVRPIALGGFGASPPKGKGTPLVTPLSIFEDSARLHAVPRGPVSALLVEVTTDEGIVGYGSVGAAAGAAIYTIENHLKSLVLGEDPFDTELLWEKMFRSTINYGRKGMTIEAISAIDIALWDIKGKATGQPVYNLLGGKTRDRIRVYASRLYATEDLEQLAAEAQQYLSQGFTAMKQRFGYGPADGVVGMRKNVELVKTVREAVGYNVELMADVYMGWDVEYALRMVRLLEPYQLRWIEEPVLPDDLEGYAQVKAAANAVGILVSGGEHEFTRYGMRELIEKRAVDILQPDVNRVGGITEAQKIWAMAAAHNLPVIPHAGQAHNHHLIISHLNSPLAEHFPPPSGVPDGNELFWWIFQGEPLPQDGYIRLPDKPGLGLALNEEIVARHSLQP